MKSNIASNDVTDCCGCGACINICPVNAINYASDMFDFIVPSVNDKKCIQCGKCMNVCPMLVQPLKQKAEYAYAAICKDKGIRIQSSSGGIFSVLAEYVIKQCGVVYGCTMDDSYQVKHISIDCIEELKRLRQSKYIQSYMNDTYVSVKKDLLLNKVVLFCGTPCIVAALKNYLDKIDTTNLIIVDLVCHGVPSQAFFNDYLRCLQRKVGLISKYEFRAKNDVDNGMNWFFSYTLQKNNKRIVRNWPEDSFNFFYMRAYVYRESCYSCKYAEIKRPGDFTLCDYWDWDKYHNQFCKGTTVSGVLLNTPKAKKIWTKISNQVNYVQTDLNNIAKHNSCLIRPVLRPIERENILEYWKQEGYEQLDCQFRNKARGIILKNKLFRLAPKSLKNFYKIIKK